MKALMVLAALFAGACGGPASEPAPTEVVVWHSLGSWSGRGNAQTESFLGLTGSLRFHWKTTTDAPGSPGSFRLVLASAISGRELLAPVDELGAGEGTAYVAEDPRVFHMLVESTDVDWTFTVEEASFGTQSTARP